MTFWTVAIAGGVEKALADWPITACRRKNANLDKDGVDVTLQAPIDSVDPFPYGTKITIWRNRTSGGASAASPTNSGLPPVGANTFSGGTIFFVGYSAHNRKRSNPSEESFNYHFAGPWEWFIERTIMKQLFFSWSSLANAGAGGNIAAFRGQFVLGMSLNTLIGTLDTVPGSSATNLMSIRQVVIQIIQYAIAASAVEYGTAQFSFDTLSSGGANTSFNLNGSNLAGLIASGAQCLIPDYVPGFEASGQSNQGLPTVKVNGAPFNVSLRAPLETVNNTHCSDCLRYELKWLVGFLGSLSISFDYTQTPPALKIALRPFGANQTLPTVNLPYPLPNSAPLVGPSGQAFSATVSDIIRRDDLLPTCVHIQFRIVSSVNGAQRSVIINDIAAIATPAMVAAELAAGNAAIIAGQIIEGIGLDGSLCSPSQWMQVGGPTQFYSQATQIALLGGVVAGSQVLGIAQAPGSKSACIDMEGGDQNLCVFTTIPISTPTAPYLGGTGDPISDANALAMWHFLLPQLITATGLTLVSGSSVVATDDQGNVLDLTKYAYILPDNAIPGWLNGYNPNATATPPLPLVKQATITGQLSYTELATVTGLGTVATKIVPHQEFSAHCTLIQIPGGTYAEYSGSEIIPFGMAGFIFGVESVLQHEGTLTLKENEITDMCPIGSCLNLTGSANAEWSTMQAQVQMVTYDILTGQSEICFGPAVHLGAQNMIELNRVNRGPRNFYLIGGNLANAAGSGNSAPTNNAQRAPGKGTEQNSVSITHVSLADSQAHAAAYAALGGGVPGITTDVRTSGQPNYGAISGYTYGSSSPVTVPAPSAPDQPVIHLQSGTGGYYSCCARLTRPTTTATTLGITNIQYAGILAKARPKASPSSTAANPTKHPSMNNPATTTDVVTSLKAAYDAVLASRGNLAMAGKNTKYLDSAAPMLAASINRLNSHIYWVEQNAPAAPVSGTATVPVAPAGVPPASSAQSTKPMV